MDWAPPTAENELASSASSPKAAWSPLAPATGGRVAVVEVARVPYPTRFGRFELRAFRGSSECLYIALCKGDLEDQEGLLVRIHSECLTGDALGSRRCDCGEQLQLALRAIADAGQGVLVYVTGHEGRGIGLLDKLRAYALQDQGYDTVDANLVLRHPADLRDYGEAGQVLLALGVQSVRLLTANGEKSDALERCGIRVAKLSPLHVPPAIDRAVYQRTKSERMGHLSPPSSTTAVMSVADLEALLGPDASNVRAMRPFTIASVLQFVGGGLAPTGWLDGRAQSRMMRGGCDAILTEQAAVRSDFPGWPPITISIAQDGFTEASPSDDLLVRVLPDSASRSTIETIQAGGATVRFASMRTDGLFDPHDLVAIAAEIGVRTMLLEVGPRLVEAFAVAEVLDRIVIGLIDDCPNHDVFASGNGRSEVLNGVEFAYSKAVLAEGQLVVCGTLTPNRADEGRVA